MKRLVRRPWCVTRVAAPASRDAPIIRRHPRESRSRPGGALETADRYQIPMRRVSPRGELSFLAHSCFHYPSFRKRRRRYAESIARGYRDIPSQIRRLPWPHNGLRVDARNDRLVNHSGLDPESIPAEWHTNPQAQTLQNGTVRIRFRLLPGGNLVLRALPPRCRIFRARQSG